MDWKFSLQLLITFFVAALGWWIAHWLTSKRELNNERRKIVVQSLIDAYRKLENASNRESPNWSDFETAIADIQLLGSFRQATLAMDFSDSMAKDKTAPLDPLLLELRDSLRSELQLALLPNKIKYFRWVPAKRTSTNSHKK